MDQDIGIAVSVSNPKQVVVEDLGTVDDGFTVHDDQAEQSRGKERTAYSIPCTTAAMEEMTAI